MGCDALLKLDSWHRWEELLTVAHIVVIARPGWHFPDTGQVADWLASHHKSDRQILNTRAFGSVLIEELRPLAISSTEIRELLQSGRSVRYLLPEPVLDYIESRQLYQ